MTAKHKNRTNRTEKTPKNTDLFNCECGKVYKARNSLWYHKQQCNEICTTFVNSGIDDISSKTEDSGEIVQTMMHLIKQNQEFKSLLVEQQKHKSRI